MADPKINFPQDLLAAQQELHQVRSDLSALYKRLPWSVEPLPGWTHTRENGHFYENERPDSPGWSDEEKKQVEGLRARQMELATYVLTHEFWASCEDAPAARSALKHDHAREREGSDDAVA